MCNLQEEIYNFLCYDIGNIPTEKEKIIAIDKYISYAKYELSVLNKRMDQLKEKREELMKEQIAREPDKKPKWIVYVREYQSNTNIGRRDLESLNDLIFKNDLDYRYSVQNTNTGDMYWELTEKQVRELRGDFI